MQIIAVGGGPGGGGDGFNPAEYQGGCCSPKPDPILVNMIQRHNHEQNPPRAFLEYMRLQGCSSKLSRACWEKAKRLRGMPFSIQSVQALLAAESLQG